MTLLLSVSLFAVPWLWSPADGLSASYRWLWTSLCAGGAILAHLRAEKPFELPRLWIPLLLWLLWTAPLWIPGYRTPETALVWTRHLGVILIGVFTSIHLRKTDRWRPILCALALAGTAGYLITLGRYGPAAIAIPFRNAYEAFFTNTNIAAQWLCLTIPITAGLWLEKRKPVWLIALLPQAAHLLLTQCRGAWVGTAGGLAVLFWIVKSFPFGKGRALLLLSLPVLAAPFLLPPAVLGPLRPTAERAHSILNPRETGVVSRLHLFKQGLNAFGDHPWTGIGPGNYPRVSERYRTPEERRSSGVMVFYSHVHNEYLQALIHTGLIGGGLLAWFLALLALQIRRVLRDAPTETRALAAGAAGGLAAVHLHALFEPNFAGPVIPLGYALLSGLFAGAGGPLISTKKSVWPAFRGIWLVPAIALPCLAFLPLEAQYEYRMGLQEKWSSRDHVSALTRLRKARSLDAALWSVPSAIWDCEKALGNHTAAVLEIRQSLSRMAPTAQTLCALSESLSKIRGGRAEAEALLERAFSMEPQSAEAAYALSTRQWLRGNTARSIRTLETFLSARPSERHDRLELYEVLRQRYRLTGRSGPGDPKLRRSYLIGLAAYHRRYGNPSASETFLDQAEALRPEDLFPVHLERTRTRLSSDRPESAGIPLSAMERTAGKTSSRRALVRFYRGELHFAKREWEDALREYRNAMRIAPNFQTADGKNILIQMSIASERLGRPHRAAAYRKMAARVYRWGPQ